MKETFEFSGPVRLQFGEGLVERLGEFCTGAGRVLVVTGRSSAARSGLFTRIRNAMGNCQVELFAEVEPNPSIQTVERGARLARQAHSDLILGAGGGSAMDAAKAIAVLASNDLPFDRLLGRENFPRPPLRLFAVPTTCGTGSEANRYAIITDVDKYDKVNFSNGQTYPERGILDPTVLEGMPADLLVSTAFDAFSHAFEGYTSRRSQPFADLLAVEAMGQILSRLPSAVRGDADSKSNLLYAASLAGIVIDHTGTTVLHALGYYLTLRHNVPHGTANAVMLPALFSYLESVASEKVRRVYELLPGDSRDLSGLERYMEQVGLAPGLAPYNFNERELRSMCRYAAGKKNANATVGHVDADVLYRLLKDRT